MDMSGKTCVVTGATSGIGRATIGALNRAGARLVLVARSAEKAEQTRKELLAEFAILENYEERMRHDLFARMDVLMCHTTDQIEQAFGKDREARQTRRGSDRVRGLGLAAMVLVCFGLSFAMNCSSQSR